MSFYGGLATTAAALIKSKGQALTLNLVTAPVAPATSATATAPVEVAKKVYGVVLAMPTKEVDNVQVLRTDKKVLLSVEGVTRDPSTFDSLVIGGERHEIITAKTLAPAGIAVIYTLQVRKGG